MINLLPTHVKDMYRFARRNRVLRRWLLVMGASLAGAVVLSAAGYFYLQQSINSYTTQIATANQQLKSADFQKVDNQVKTISDNLKLVNQVLSKEILFSKLLKSLGKATPDNVILTGLNISQVQGGLSISAQTTDYKAATQLQLNLADPKNQIFSKADIVSINCKGGDVEYANYPCTVGIQALFGSNSPFLFINNGKQVQS